LFNAKSAPSLGAWRQIEYTARAVFRASPLRKRGEDEGEGIELAAEHYR
jgi:hypothetical protein